MQAINLHQAKTHLSSLVEKVYQGEEILICKAGKPMVKLIKYEANKTPRTPGLLKGQIIISDDFDELPQDLLDAFEGKNK